MRYLTTNVRIEENSLKELKLRAIDEGKRVAELIREAIFNYLHKAQGKIGKRRFKKDPLFSIAGICRTGMKNSSESHDEYLYGKKK